jgi:hypothetical protein
VRLRDFIEVRVDTRADPGPGRDFAGHPPAAGQIDDPGAQPDAAVLAPSAEPRWSLWGDAEA